MAEKELKTKIRKTKAGEKKVRKLDLDIGDYKTKVAYTNRNEQRIYLQKQIREFVKRYTEEKKRF